MSPIKKINVAPRFTYFDLPVGQLVSDNGKIYFNYHLDFIKSSLQISPFKMGYPQEFYILKHLFLKAFSVCSTIHCPMDGADC